MDQDALQHDLSLLYQYASKWELSLIIDQCVSTRELSLIMDQHALQCDLSLIYQYASKWELSLIIDQCLNTWIEPYYGSACLTMWFEPYLSICFKMRTEPYYWPACLNTWIGPYHSVWLKIELPRLLVNLVDVRFQRICNSCYGVNTTARMDWQTDWQTVFQVKRIFTGPYRSMQSTRTSCVGVWCLQYMSCIGVFSMQYMYVLYRGV